MEITESIEIGVRLVCEIFLLLACAVYLGRSFT